MESRLSRLRDARVKIAAMRAMEAVHGGNPTYWRKLAVGLYDFWLLALSPVAKADALTAITRAVSFEANKEHPALWWSAAKLFIASANFAGATRLMQQVTARLGEWGPPRVCLGSSGTPGLTGRLARAACRSLWTTPPSWACPLS